MAETMRKWRGWGRDTTNDEPLIRAQLDAMRSLYLDGDARAGRTTIESLAAQNGIATSAVRRIITRLRDRGEIISKQGKGIFISRDAYDAFFGRDEESKKVTERQKAVEFLADIVEKSGGKVHASTNQIAAMLGISENSVGNIMKRARLRGHVEFTSAAGEGYVIWSTRGKV